MKLKTLEMELSVCKLFSPADWQSDADFFFLSRTDEELSLVCRTEDAPPRTLAREDGWQAFRVEGVLDFSLVGILAGITGALAEDGIGLFAVSTYNTDYVLVKKENFARALEGLRRRGYEVE